MQPYMFPYFPYVQLLACVDVFIIFDTAQFISRGWANRNVIDLNGSAHTFVLPVSKHSREASFADIRFAENFDSDLKRLKATLDHALHLAPFRSAALELIDEAFPAEISANMFLVDAFERMANALMATIDFRTRVVRASELQPRVEPSAQDYIIRMVKEVGGEHYINAVGGRMLYDHAAFTCQGVDLSFLSTIPGIPDDDPKPFNGSLSILDSLAHHSPQELRKRLEDFAFVKRADARLL